MRQHQRSLLRHSRRAYRAQLRIRLPPRIPGISRVPASSHLPSTLKADASSRICPKLSCSLALCPSSCPRTSGRCRSLRESAVKIIPIARTEESRITKLPFPAHPRSRLPGVSGSPLCPRGRRSRLARGRHYQPGHRRPVLHQPRYIRWHLRAIYAKLGVSDRNAALRPARDKMSSALREQRKKSS